MAGGNGEQDPSSDPALEVVPSEELELAATAAQAWLGDLENEETGGYQYANS